MASQSVLKNQLLKRKFSLEDGVARVAHTRKQLKDNADLVKEDIRKCFGHQLSLLRTREQQLLSTLDTVIAVKDEILSEQQDIIHQALGACNQSEEFLASETQSDAVDTVLLNLEDTLNRLSHIDLQPKETAHVAFEADHTAIRRYIQTFGRISSAPRSRSLKHESLPDIDMDDYEDNSSLSHKPIHLLNKSLASVSLSPRLSMDQQSKMFREAVSGTAYTQNVLDTTASRYAGQLSAANRTVNPGYQLKHWLQQMKSVESEPGVFEDFEIVADQSTRSTNSVESGKPESLFSGYFSKIQSSPASEWTFTEECFPSNTIVPAETPSMMEEKTVEAPANAKGMLRKSEEDELHCGEENDWLETAFNRVLHSRPEQWLLASSEEAKKLGGTTLETTETAKWLANETVANNLYGEMDVEVFESILGWQAILEKVHGQGDENWLIKS